MNLSLFLRGIQWLCMDNVTLCGTESWSDVGNNLTPTFFSDLHRSYLLPLPLHIDLPVHTFSLSLSYVALLVFLCDIHPIYLHMRPQGGSLMRVCLYYLFNVSSVVHKLSLVRPQIWICLQCAPPNYCTYYLCHARGLANSHRTWHLNTRARGFCLCTVPWKSGVLCYSI